MWKIRGGSLSRAILDGKISRNVRETRSVEKVSRILNFRGLPIFDFRFFAALCWYSYPSFMPTNSANLNVQLIFDSYFTWTCFGSTMIFTSSVLGTNKSHTG